VILGELATRWQPSGSFLAYFFRSFPRAMQRYVRQAGSRATSSVQMVSLPHDDLVGAVDRMTAEPAGEQALSWLEHLAGLPPGPRIALALRILEECDFETIGRALHVSRATAHRLYRRALATVAGTLTDA
jgi:DNA-directed RNA polymerase specialized sigma24 family protein